MEDSGLVLFWVISWDELCVLFLLLNSESTSERVRVRASFGIGLSIGGSVVG